jgi:hypothetical protein
MAGAPVLDGSIPSVNRPLEPNIESFQFPSGSDTVTMKLLFANDGPLTGSIDFGDGPQLPPPSDPNVGYPPGCNGSMKAYEGFWFTLLGGTLTAQRVQLGLWSAEIYNAWCKLLTPYQGWVCGDNWGGGGCANGLEAGCCTNPPDGGATVHLDCCKFQLCQANTGVCICDNAGCNANIPPILPQWADLLFDMHLSGTNLDGSITGPLGNHNVHLVQQ